MEFRLLGPLEIIINRQQINIGAARQATALAMLLMDANRVVSVSRLVDPKLRALHAELRPLPRAGRVRAGRLTQGWLGRDSSTWFRSHRWMKQLQHRYNATMVYGHDATVLEELTKQAKTFD